MPSVSTRVVGMTFVVPDATPRVLRLAPGTALDLRREPGNRHDRNAVAVYINQLRVGYVPATVAASVAPIIDAEEHIVTAVRSRDAFGGITLTWTRVAGDPLA